MWNFHERACRVLPRLRARHRIAALPAKPLHHPSTRRSILRPLNILSTSNATTVITAAACRSPLALPLVASIAQIAGVSAFCIKSRRVKPRGFRNSGQSCRARLLWGPSVSAASGPRQGQGATAPAEQFRTVRCSGKARRWAMTRHACSNQPEVIICQHVTQDNAPIIATFLVS